MTQAAQALTTDEMRSELRKFISKFDTQAAAAAKLSTTSSHLSEILSGKRSIGDAIAAQLGFAVMKAKKTVTVKFYIGSRSV